MVSQIHLTRAKYKKQKSDFSNLASKYFFSLKVGKKRDKNLIFLFFSKKIYFFSKKNVIFVKFIKTFNL